MPRSERTLRSHVGLLDAFAGSIPERIVPSPSPANEGAFPSDKRAVYRSGFPDRQELYRRSPKNVANSELVRPCAEAWLGLCRCWPLAQISLDLLRSIEPIVFYFYRIQHTTET